MNAATFDADSDDGIVSLFSGPGGWCEGFRRANPAMHARLVGIEYDRAACATRRAAGHRTIEADVRTINPRDWRGRIRGLVASPPCQPWSAGGNRAGLDDYQHVLDAICCLAEDCSCSTEWLPTLVSDQRTALMTEPIRWIVEAQPDWVLLEQVPALEYAWEDIAAELYAADWEWADVAVLDAADFGAPQHRRRVFLAAHRYRPCNLPTPTHGPGRPLPWNTPQSALGLTGTLGFPRRNDRLDGGTYRARDLRPVDQPSFTLTEKVRSWRNVADDGTVTGLSMEQISTLAGFRPDYPWVGSRTAQCLQAANAVCPLVAEQLVQCIATGDEAHQALLARYANAA